MNVVNRTNALPVTEAEAASGVSVGSQTIGGTSGFDTTDRFGPISAVRDTHEVLGSEQVATEGLVTRIPWPSDAVNLSNGAFGTNHFFNDTEQLASELVPTEVAPSSVAATYVLSSSGIVNMSRVIPLPTDVFDLTVGEASQNPLGQSRKIGNVAVSLSQPSVGSGSIQVSSDGGARGAGFPTAIVAAAASGAVVALAVVTAVVLWLTTGNAEMDASIHELPGLEGGDVTMDTAESSVFTFDLGTDAVAYTTCGTDGPMDSLCPD
jgi:hypothetical protein